MDRPNETLIPAQTPWLHDADAQAVCRAINAGGARIYFVGGCVRDAVLGMPVGDIDLSTDAEPVEVMHLAAAAGLKVVPTGIDHGTVTVVSGGKGFEVTTFRRDVETDGRRAVVAFSRDIRDDASRRDFTLNALYATSKGQLVDPLGGLPDCLARRIRFIQDADQRIKEDYLRILRFFRFHAWYSDPGDGFDPVALDAITRNSEGLETLSAERVGSEVIRLMAAPDPCRAVAGMRQAGCLQRILPGSDDTFLGPVVHLESLLGVGGDPIRRLAALGGEAVAARLRLSRAQERVLELAVTIGWSGPPVSEIAYRFGQNAAVTALILRAVLANETVDPADLSRIARAAKQVFPVTARDLMPALSGKALGDHLRALEARWIASGFSMGRDALLASK